MKTYFRQSMAWLHTWSSLVTGWAIFFIFVTGTASYFMYDITRWMEPERPLEVGLQQAPQAEQVEQALDLLIAQFPDARLWQIKPAHIRNQPDNVASRTHLVVRAFPNPRPQWFDPLTGEEVLRPEVRETEGGVAFRRMHHQFHYMDEMTGIYLAGLCAFLALVAVVTGVIVHKKIFKDFFAFRPGKGQRSWLDAHNVSSVMALPFFVMILYTGLVYYSGHYLPIPGDIVAHFKPDAPTKPAELAIGLRPQVPMAQLIAEAEAVFGEGNVGQIMVQHRQGQGLSVDVSRPFGSELTRTVTDSTTLRFDAFTGRRLSVVGGHDGGTAWFRTLVSLHEAWYATYPLRWLYFISGLLGCFMIATGMVLWVVKRRTRHTKGDTPEHFGLRLMACLNVAVLAGLPVAVAAYFWANRLLPVSMAERAAWELHAMFLVWGWLFCYAALRPEKRAWVETLWLATGAFGLVPVVNALTTDRHLGVTIVAGDWPLAGFDLTMFGLAAMFGTIAWKLGRRGIKADTPSVAANIFAAGRQ